MIVAEANEAKTNNVNNKARRKEICEPEFAETVFVRDIENKVFQTIVLQCLARVDGISLLGGTFIDNILGRDQNEAVRGIHAEQDSKSRSVNCKVEVNIRYGMPIPDKAEEIQNLISREITRLTGLHVACVHVVFKNVVLQTPKIDPELRNKRDESKEKAPVLLSNHLEEEFANEF